MASLIKTLKKPTLWIYFTVIYIWILAISVLIATLSPPYLVAKMVHPKNSSSITYFIESFPLYVQETAKILNVNSNVVLYLFFSNIVIFPVAILVGFFVLRKRMWARNLMISIIIILILQPIILEIVLYGSFFDDSIIESSMELIIFLLIIYVLTRKSTKEVFQRRMKT